MAIKFQLEKFWLKKITTWENVVTTGVEQSSAAGRGIKDALNRIRGWLGFAASSFVWEWWSHCISHPSPWPNVCPLQLLLPKRADRRWVETSEIQMGFLIVQSYRVTQGSSWRSPALRDKMWDASRLCCENEQHKAKSSIRKTHFFPWLQSAHSRNITHCPLKPGERLHPHPDVWNSTF